MNRDFVETAALLSDPGRARIVMALLGGVALPAGQLAMIAEVAPQTASSHLSKLVEGDLLAVEQQGRHRYYRLAGGEVADAIEALMAIAPRSRVPPLARPGQADGLAYARTCYSHLAGRLAVEIAEALKKRELLAAPDRKRLTVTKRGQRWFEQLGIAISESSVLHPRYARPCLDWTERRHHVGGRLGSAMLARFRELHWIATVRNSRAARVTLEGERQLRQLLGVVVPRR